MPRPKKTQAERQAVRLQILDAAYEILQESGPEAISSRAIAERMGVAHMSLYTYFPNQAAILSALREREMARWRLKQQELAQRARSEGVLAVVQKLLEMNIQFARETPHVYRLAWVLPEASGESPEQSRQRMRANVEQLASLLEQGMAHGEIQPRQPFLAASTVLAMVNTPFILYYSGRMLDINLRDRMVEEILSAAMAYLKKGK